MKNVELVVLGVCEQVVAEAFTDVGDSVQRGVLANQLVGIEGIG